MLFPIIKSFKMVFTLVIFVIFKFDHIEVNWVFWKVSKNVSSVDVKILHSCS